MRERGKEGKRKGEEKSERWRELVEEGKKM